MSGLNNLWNKLSLLKRTMLVAVFALGLTLIGSTMHFANQHKLVPLITAERETIAQIVAYLTQNNIEHTVVSENSIMVDKSIKYKTLLTLAKENLLGHNMEKSNEIFDEFSFGMTDELLERNKTRDFQGKLEQMIVQGNSNIKKAHVLLKIPKQNADESESNPPQEEAIQNTPTATVKVLCKSRLSRQSVKGIQHLITAAVPNLKLEHVVIVDQDNALLSDDTQKQ